MLNYQESIREFLNENFSPSNPENANAKFTTNELLGFLFRIFPEKCISDYDLSDILISLKYSRFTYVVESFTEVGEKDDKEYEIHRSLEVGWCLKTPLDLHTITVADIKDRS